MGRGSQKQTSDVLQQQNKGKQAKILPLELT